MHLCSMSDHFMKNKENCPDHAVRNETSSSLKATQWWGRRWHCSWFLQHISPQKIGLASPAARLNVIKEIHDFPSRLISLCTAAMDINFASMLNVSPIKRCGMQVVMSFATLQVDVLSIYVSNLDVLEVMKQQASDNLPKIMMSIQKFLYLFKTDEKQYQLYPAFNFNYWLW